MAMLAAQDPLVEGHRPGDRRRRPCLNRGPSPWIRSSTGFVSARRQEYRRSATTVHSAPQSISLDSTRLQAADRWRNGA